MKKNKRKTKKWRCRICRFEFANKQQLIKDLKFHKANVECSIEWDKEQIESNEEDLTIIKEELAKLIYIMNNDKQEGKILKWDAIAFSTRQWDLINTSLLKAQELKEIWGEDWDYVYRWTKKVSSLPT